jgi:hypothetical protein
MKKFTLIVALLLAASPVAAQVATSNAQTSGGQAGQSASSQASTIGAICIEEMTATFCSVASGANSGGFQSRGSSGGAGSNTPSGATPTCGDEWPANELCD